MKLNRTNLKKMRKMLLNIKPHEVFNMSAGCYCLGGYMDKKLIKATTRYESWAMFVIRGYETRGKEIESMSFIWNFLYDSDWKTYCNMSKKNQIADCIGRIDALLAGYVDWK